MADPRRTYGRREVLAGLAALAVAGVAGCAARGRAAPGPSPSTATPSSSPTAPTPTPAPTPTTPDVDVEVMVGQMLLLGFRGTTAADATVLADLRDRHVGGVLLFSRDVPSGGGRRNVESPDQVAALCAGLRAEATHGLLVAVDQEGGRVARLDPAHGFPPTRSAAELGALDDPAVTREASAAIARTLLAAGVDLNLAPVVDVDVNPGNPVIGALDRSFSADPAVVSRQAAAFVAGHRDVGVATALKHFPGHGSSRGDTHAGFVDVSATWQEAELDPYRDLLAGGYPGAVLVAHVVNDRFDARYPASLSSATIDGLLRRDLGFDGVVISDDLQMRAVTDGWSLPDAVALAVGAGTDLLTFGNNVDTFDPDVGARAYDALLGLVRSGQVTEERIAQSYRRLTALRATTAV